MILTTREDVDYFLLLYFITKTILLLTSISRAFEVYV